jgi:hypothetical protein
MAKILKAPKNKVSSYWFPAIAALALAITQGQAAFAADQADLIVSNARVFTGSYLTGKAGSSDVPQLASCLACAGGKIIYVGDAKGIAALKGPQTKELNLGGELVLPGFHDCHVHLCEGGIELNGCLLSGSKTKQAALSKLKEYAAKNGQKHAKSSWLIASGLPLPAVQASPLTKEDIDSIENVRPVLIWSEDAHSLWLNSRALKLAKIDVNTKTPEAGVIEREKDGSPNGCLREEAMDLIDKIVPEPPLKVRTAALKKAVLLANSLGITSIQDAHSREEFLSTYFELAKKQELNLKVVAALHVGKNLSDKDFDHLVQLREKYTTGNLKATSAKIFADGVIETHTAAMIEPYVGVKPETRGTLDYNPEELKRMVLALDKRGFQVHIHAIGDRAVRVALDALEQAKAVGGSDYEKHRHQIAHLEIIQKADIPRFKKLSVIANFQSYWAFYDPYMIELTMPSMGPERMKLIYPIHSVLSSGAHLAAGSDWTVSTLSPLKAMQIATTRKAPGKPYAKVLLKDECVSLKDILAAYTTGGAYANHSEDSTGSLTVGKAADFIVLDRDIFAIKPEQLGQTRVLKTFVDGKLVFDRSRPGDRAVSE